MKFSITAFLMLFALYGLSQEAKEIVQKADAKMRGSTMQAEMIIKTIRPSWTREMQCKTWMKGNNLVNSPVFPENEMEFLNVAVVEKLHTSG